MRWSDFEVDEQRQTTDYDQAYHDQDLMHLLACRLLRAPGFGPIDDGLQEFRIPDTFRQKLQRAHPSEERLSEALFRQQVDALESATINRQQEPLHLSFTGVLGALADRLMLSRTEHKLLSVLFLQARYPDFNSLMRLREEGNLPACLSAFANALGEDISDIFTAMKKDSTLIALELAKTNTSPEHLLEFLRPGKLLETIDQACRIPDSNPETAMSQLFRRIAPLAPAAEHSITAFEGMADLELIRQLLRNAAVGEMPGCNILLHGNPGTGKTQLARALACSLGLRLFEVPFEDEDGKVLTGNLRLQSSQIAQNLLADQQQALILFDEMEDALRDESKFPKAWFNKLLEHNTTPCIWITNRAWSVDSALLRRFTYIVEIGEERNARTRERVTKWLEKLPVTSGWRGNAAQQDWMTPAMAENLHTVGHFLPARQPERNEKRLEQIIEQRLQVTNATDAASVPNLATDTRPSQKQGAMPAFDQRWLNTTPSLRALEQTLQTQPNARLCLHGPPGTGKTAFAHWLAAPLARPVRLVSGSDLMSPFVGMTEYNIAQMFRSAQKNGEVLVLDEADTFLADRRGAHHSWETSSVNEFMVRLEAFEGIFIATTNRFEHLDRAVMRRLPLKVRFEPLPGSQLKNLLTECVLDPERLTEFGTTLSQLTAVTPGLVAAAMQQLRMLGLRPLCRNLLPALREEQVAHNGSDTGAGMGFLTDV